MKLEQKEMDFLEWKSLYYCVNQQYDYSMDK